MSSPVQGTWIEIYCAEKKVTIGEIKAFGRYTAEIKLYTGISAKMGVEVGE